MLSVDSLFYKMMVFLVSVTDLKVFGCSIDFLQTATQTYPEDPIWNKLQQSMECTVVFRDSSILPSQEQLKGCSVYHVPLAVHVSMNTEEVVPEGAFSGVPRLRHVSVEPDRADCKLLNSVSAPGCRKFGRKALRNAAPCGVCIGWGKRPQGHLD